MSLPRGTMLALGVACLFLVAGCGGGGGGSSSGSLTYATDWSNADTPGGLLTGESQRVSLFNAGGNLVSSLIVNRDLDGIQSTKFAGLPKGTYRIKVELNNARNFAGQVVGEIEQPIEIRGAEQYETDVAQATTAVSVFPNSLSLIAQQTKQYFAVALTQDNDATFVEPDGFIWTANGGVASVDEDGLVTATTAGQGSITAREDFSDVQGSASLSVSPFNTKKGKWTVLVFLNAANDLYQFSDLNVNQMEQVAGNQDVRFVVQWKQAAIPGISTNPPPSFTGTRRYLIQQDNTSAITSPVVQDMGNNVDMGLASTLREFISWGKTFYPADHYVLVVWNHGNGWKRSKFNQTITRGVSYDDETGSSINTWELVEAIGDNHFDILAWDASLMQMIEVATEVQDQFDFIVGSEESPPGEGYPYHTVFAPFRDNPDATPRQLSKNFVDATLDVPAYATRKITQSVIDTAKIPALNQKISELANVLIAKNAGLGTIIPVIRSAAQRYEPPPRYYYDLYDICLRLENLTSDPQITNATSAVRAAIDDAVVWEGHNANSPGSHGIAIDFSPGDSFDNWDADYAQLRFAQETTWDEWLSIAP